MSGEPAGPEENGRDQDLSIVSSAETGEKSGSYKSSTTRRGGFFEGGHGDPAGSNALSD